jgi:hypothetical protein
MFCIDMRHRRSTTTRIKGGGRCRVTGGALLMRSPRRADRATRLTRAAGPRSDAGKRCVNGAKKGARKNTATRTACPLARRRLKKEMARGCPADQVGKLFVGRRHRLFMATIHFLRVRHIVKTRYRITSKKLIKRARVNKAKPPRQSRNRHMLTATGHRCSPALS